MAKAALADALRHVEPDFVFTPEMAQTYRDLTLWALRCGDGPMRPDRGLWLWGNIGTGKSTLMQGLKLMCRLVRPSDDPPCRPSWRIEGAGQICRDYQRDGAAGVGQYHSSLSLCIDDIGTEPQLTNHYGTAVNVIGDLLLARYDMRRTALTHVTANISPDDICECYGPRVWDRCREMFNFVEMAGRSWRKAKSTL